MIEVLRQVSERHVFDARRGEFDGERQPVEPQTDISGDSNCVTVMGEKGRVRQRALEEQFDCSRLSTAAGVNAHCKGLQREQALAADIQR
jgi:hypothetical protein